MFQQTEIREGKWAKVGNNKQCGLPLGVCKAYVAVLRSDIVGEALRTFGHAISDFRRTHGLILSNVFEVYNCYFTCEIGEIPTSSNGYAIKLTSFAIKTKNNIKALVHTEVWYRIEQ